MNECKKGACGTTQIKSSPDTQEEKVKKSLEKIKHTFMVMSGKGGVGKTSVAVNLAIALSEKGFRVGLMDVDIHGPDVPRMLGIQGMLDLNAARKLTPMAYSDTLKAVSIESLIAGRDTAIIWRGPLKYSVINQFVGDVDWGNLDYMVIDAPPGTGDEPLTVAQIIKNAKAVVVTTPQEVSLADVRKSIDFCGKVNMEILGIIENMSGFSCPHCGETVNLFGYGGGEKTADAYGIPFLGRIPVDPEMVACGDEGRSFQKEFADSPVTKAFTDIADAVVRRYPV